MKKAIKITLSVLILVFIIYTLYSLNIIFRLKENVNELENIINETQNVTEIDTDINTFNFRENEFIDLENYYQPEICNRIIRSCNELEEFNKLTSNRFNISSSRYNESFFEENALIVFESEFGQYDEVKPFVSCINTEENILKIEVTRQFYFNGIFGDAEQVFGGSIEISNCITDKISNIEVSAKTHFWTE